MPERRYSRAAAKKSASVEGAPGVWSRPAFFVPPPPPPPPIPGATMGLPFTWSTSAELCAAQESKRACEKRAGPHIEALHCTERTMSPAPLA